MTTRQNNNRFFLCLGAILIAAALIRYYQAFNRGLSYWDEGLFIMGARFVRWRTGILFYELQNTIGHHVAPALPGLYRGLPVFLQKPAHVLLLTVWTLPGWNEVMAAVSYSIHWSLVSIGCTAFLGRRWFNASAGLFAALWLSFQPYHVHYSRLALHETDSMALFLLAMLSWSVMHEKGGFFRGVCTGALAALALGASYRYLPMIALGMGFEVFAAVRKNPAPRYWLKRWLSLAVGITGILCLLNASYRILFSPDYLWSQPGSYLDVLKMKFFGGESSFDLEHPFFYLQMMYRFDGIWILTVSLAAAGFLLIVRRKLPGMLFLWILCPLLLFSITRTRVPRTISMTLPFWALAVGYLLSRLIRERSSARIPPAVRRTLVVLVIAISAASAVPSLHRIWGLRSGYEDVIQWLNNHANPTHLSTMAPIYAVYQGRRAVRPVPFTPEEILREVETTGVRYLTVDWQKFLRYSRGVYEIEKAVLPVYVAPNNTGTFFASLHENHLPEDIEKLRTDPTLAYVKVYDLHEALRAMGYTVTVPEK